MNLKTISSLLLCVFLFSLMHAQANWENSTILKLKSSSAENAQSTPLVFDQKGWAQNLPSHLKVKQEVQVTAENTTRYSYTISTEKEVHFSLHHNWSLSNYQLEEVDFYMPGFWYKKNLRSPKNAPSIQVAKTWSVRDDRLSSPLVAALNTKTGNYAFVRRGDPLKQESLLPKKGGEVILPTKSSIGSLGFATNPNTNQVSLTAQYPFYEAPYSYQSKLTLKPELESFVTLKAGESISFAWEIVEGQAEDFTDLVMQVWPQSFDFHQPQPLEKNLSNYEIKSILSNYFKESLATTNGLTGFSGLWFDMQSCETTGVLSVGFCGRTLLNAFNLLEFATQNKDQELLDLANEVIASYIKDGWTESGLIRELIYGDYKEDVYSLRKQTEGILALLYIMKFKKEAGEEVALLEKKIERLLDQFAGMQAKDGSLPRKFGIDFKVLDDSKGSTQLIITPMLMAYKYFDKPSYLKVAKKAAQFVEDNLIAKADYFSSTLDSNCEDKEAALIASTSLYHLAMLTKKAKEKQHLMDLAEQSATFALSWYYLYDVPFAKGQLLKGANLKTRGWGSVSTENNHIDVYIFDFLEVLRWLGKERSRTRFLKMADVIESSIRDQMLPYPYHMVSVGKEGFMPEIIQQTLWDYGANGKGFLNVHGSIGWTVASVWEMLSPGRFEWFID